jgi:hypothetical protein
MDTPHINFMALTAAYNWEPSLALMPVTATAGQFAAENTSVGVGPVWVRASQTQEVPDGGLWIPYIRVRTALEVTHGPNTVTRVQRATPTC